MDGGRWVAAYIGEMLPAGSGKYQRAPGKPMRERSERFIARNASDGVAEEEPGIEEAENNSCNVRFKISYLARMEERALEIEDALGRKHAKKLLTVFPVAQGRIVVTHIDPRLSRPAGLGSSIDTYPHQPDAE
jgi:hypothetical protein